MVSIRANELVERLISDFGVLTIGFVVQNQHVAEFLVDSIGVDLFALGHGGTVRITGIEIPDNN